MTRRPDHEFDEHAREIDALGREAVGEASGIVLETCFTILQFAVVSPLIALAHRIDAHRPASVTSTA